MRRELNEAPRVVVGVFRACFTVRVFGGMRAAIFAQIITANVLILECGGNPDSSGDTAFELPEMGS